MTALTGMIPTALASAASTVETPVGPFTVVIDADGRVIGSGFTATVDELLPELTQPQPRHLAGLGAVTVAVREYFAGDPSPIADVPVRQPFGGFLGRAWAALRTIPAGTHVTYAALAALAERPTAVRAAASACARNPVGLFVPCHRVLRSDGSLGGFRWGLDTKRWLLTHERGPR